MGAAKIRLSLSKPAPGRRRRAGHTLVELVATMVIVGILAAVVLPRLGDNSAFRALAFHDDLLSALRFAQKSAMGHRRLVCVNLTSSSATLTIATANPASSCGNSTLNGPDGNTAYAHSVDPLRVSASQSPSGTLYFQPDGSVSADGAGNSPSDYSISVGNLPVISIVGATGYVN